MLRSVLLVLLSGAVAAPVLGAGELKVEAVGKTTLASGKSGAQELSGLAYVGPVKGRENVHAFLAVSDTGGRVFTVWMQMDPASGRVRAAAVTPDNPEGQDRTVLKVPGAVDLEGIAWSSRDRLLFVSDEVGPSIRQIDPEDGKVLRTLPLPPVYKQKRSNLGFEALALDGRTLHLWTANEEALAVDGSTATADAGSVVRLQRFDSDGRPAGQWAYVTEPVGSSSPRGHSRERSGLCALAVLEDGTLLALERTLDMEKVLVVNVPVFISRIFRVDLEGASDVSEVDSLEDADYTPVRKHLLWEKKFRLDEPNNFEGMCLGPALEDGSRSLILISDDENGRLEQSVFALRLKKGEGKTGAEAE